MSGFSFYAGVVGFCLGILAHTFYDLALAETLLCFVVALGVGLVWRKNGSAIFAPQVLALSILILFFAFGLLRAEVATWNDVSVLDSRVGSEVSIEGVIVREPDLRERTQHLYVKTEDALVLVITDRYTDYAYGARLLVTGKVEKPQPFETDLGRTFNYAGYLESKGVRHTMRYTEIEKLSVGHGNWLQGFLLDFKHAFMKRIELVITEPAVGLGEGLLLGVKQALGDELETVFRKTGIIHIVVLSGYNVSLVVIFVMYVLSYLFPFRFRLLVGMVAIACFALLVGLSATVVRASLMAALILFAKFTGRTYAIVRALMLAGLIMLLINPLLLPYDVGFQLSFLATLGLILLAPKLESLFSFMPTFIGLREFLVATVATQIFVMPLLLYQIGEFSVVSVVVNVMVLPMVPVSMFLTFLTGLLGFVSLSLALPVAWFAQLSLQYILVVATWFAEMPFASFVVPAFSFWIVPLCYVVLFWILWKLEQPEESMKKNETEDFSRWTIETIEEVRGRSSNNSPIFFK